MEGGKTAVGYLLRGVVIRYLAKHKKKTTTRENPAEGKGQEGKNWVLAVPRGKLDTVPKITGKRVGSLCILAVNEKGHLPNTQKREEAKKRPRGLSLMVTVSKGIEKKKDIGKGLCAKTPKTANAREGYQALRKLKRDGV